MSGPVPPKGLCIPLGGDGEFTDAGEGIPPEDMPGDNGPAGELVLICGAELKPF